MSFDTKKNGNWIESREKTITDTRHEGHEHEGHEGGDDGFTIQRERMGVGNIEAWHMRMKPYQMDAISHFDLQYMQLEWRQRPLSSPPKVHENVTCSMITSILVLLPSSRGSKMLLVETFFYWAMQTNNRPTYKPKWWPIESRLQFRGGGRIKNGISISSPWLWERGSL